MKSFALKRRSFLGAVGGAFGLRILLDNMVASAAGATSPPRFLMTHWPIGTVRCLFKPTGSGSGYTPSPIVQPFIDAGLRDDMTVLYGLSQESFDAKIGGGHEAGTVMLVTGQKSPGIRANGGEPDDTVAGGPSFDQIFWKNVPELHAGGDSLSVLCDARVTANETSTACLSYAYAQRSVATADGGTVTESVPLLPELSPSKLYARLFTGFMPGGPSDANQEAALRALKHRRSVLDFALRELDKLKTLAPSSEQWKIEAHAASIRAAELQMTQPDPPGPSSNCLLPAQPAASLAAKVGSSFGIDSAAGAESDAAGLEQMGRAHMGLIIAAFQCDLTRVATFQWAPGTNHVAFKGMFPGRPDESLYHYPLALRIADSSLALGDSLPDTQDGDILRCLANIETWYNQQHASLLAQLKSTQDFYGNSLLDHTVVPFLTEVSNCTRFPRSLLPGFVFGGKALGMQHGRFLDFESSPRHQNDLWLTIAQAYLGSDALNQLIGETFDKFGVQPIAGLWQSP